MAANNLKQIGPAQDSASSQFRARFFLDSDRYRLLDRRQSYYDCTQHDYKRFDFDGRVISSAGGIAATQPLLSSEKAAWYVPLRSRRPSSPYRLARVITNSFTNLVFGEDRFPQFKVDGDPDTEDFIKAMVKSMSLPSKMIQARNLGGSVGTVGLSWCFLNGKPRCEVHNAKNLFVHEWEDRAQCVPRHVTEVYTAKVQEWDPARKRFGMTTYWYRRDWTPNMDVVFQPVRDEPGKDIVWEPDLDKSADHQNGIIHFVWIQNLPNDDIDGFPDYEGLYEPFDTLDLLLSVITRGATLNLDPTLKLKMDPDLVNRMGVRKGSDQALIVGEEGDAEYLELQGTALEAGISLVNTKRRAALETAECVIPDPDEISANGTSSVAMKMLYSPMLGKGNTIREQYAAGMTRMLDAMVTVARATLNSTTTVRDEQGNEEEVQRQIVLPQKVTRKPKLDEDGNPEIGEDGNPTGAEDVVREDRLPGEGGEIEAEWPPYFPPTPQDQSTIVTTLTTATGNQAIMSTQTATELAMEAFGRDVGDEAARVAQEKKQQADQQSQMFADANGGAGGAVAGKDGMPAGAKPGGGKPPAFGAKPGGGGGGGAGGPFGAKPAKPGGFSPFDPKK